MRNILGLHFGHNAHVVILNGKNICSYVQRERITGLKNQAGINKELIETSLSDAGMSIRDIDQVAITNTQEREFIFEDYQYFNFEFETNGCNSICDESFLNERDNLIRFNENTDNYIITKF